MVQFNEEEIYAEKELKILKINSEQLENIEREKNIQLENDAGRNILRLFKETY